MPIEDLPDYLKSNKNYHNVKNPPVVDMGRIVVPHRKWTKIATYLSALILMAGASFFGYNLLSSKNFTIEINTANIDTKIVKDIVTKEGGEIISLKKQDKNSYEVKMITKKNIDSLLEKIRKNKNILKVEIK